MVMIIAPDVFATDQGGTYTTNIATDWVAAHGHPSPLYIGRTLRYTPDHGWEYGPAKADSKLTWKALDTAPKTLRNAIGDVGDLATRASGFLPDRAAHYELIGPKIAGNPHGLDQPAIIRHGMTSSDEAADFTGVATTSLWALVRTWFPRHPYQGILWTWEDKDSDWPHYAAVRRSRLPRLEP